MRIAMIGAKGIPATAGGIEHVVEELATGLAARGHEVTVYSRADYVTAGDGYVEPPGVERRIVWTPPVRGLGALLSSGVATYAALRRGHDVYHFHAVGPSLFLPLARFLGKPTVATVHGLDWQRAKWGRLARVAIKAGERAAARWADRLVVTGPRLASHFRTVYGRETVFIPNAVRAWPEPEVAMPQPVGDRPFILCVGRLSPEKGFHDLLRAVRGEAWAPAVVFAGAADRDPAYERQLRDLAGPDTVFLGNVPGAQVAALLRRATAFVLPSTVEGMSLALLEAVAAGTRVLTSDIPENAVVVGRHGATFRAGDVADLRRKLVALLDDPEAERRAAALKRRIERLTWDRVCDAYERLYAATLSGAALELEPILRDDESEPEDSRHGAA